MQTRGFNIILCESDWTFMWHVNQYVHRKKSNMFPDTARFPDAWSDMSWNRLAVQIMTAPASEFLFCRPMSDNSGLGLDVEESAVL